MYERSIKGPIFVPLTCTQQDLQALPPHTHTHTTIQSNKGVKSTNLLSIVICAINHLHIPPCILQYKYFCTTLLKFHQKSALSIRFEVIRLNSLVKTFYNIVLSYVTDV